MTPKSKSIVIGVGSFLGGGLVLAILGMAAQFWISVEVEAQFKKVIIPDTSQLITDIEVIKTTVLATDKKADKAIENQERFEEIFTEYLINEANR
jgi:hypothetical protein